MSLLKFTIKSVSLCNCGCKECFHTWYCYFSLRSNRARETVLNAIVLETESLTKTFWRKVKRWERKPVRKALTLLSMMMTNWVLPAQTLLSWKMWKTKVLECCLLSAVSGSRPHFISFSVFCSFVVSFSSLRSREPWLQPGRQLSVLTLTSTDGSVAQCRVLFQVHFSCMSFLCLK